MHANVNTYMITSAMLFNMIISWCYDRTWHFFLLDPAMSNIICLKSHTHKSHLHHHQRIQQLIWNSSRTLPFVSIILLLIIKLVTFSGYDQPVHPQQVRSYNIGQGLCRNLFIVEKDGALVETNFQSLKSNKPNRRANLHHRFLVRDGCYIRVFPVSIEYLNEVQEV